MDMNPPLFAARIGFLLAFSFAVSGCHSPFRSPQGHGAFATGKYRNLFVENGRSAAEVDARINNTFQQLFHGDSATQAVYFSAGANSNGPLAFVSDIKHRDVRSEGMSYGMMIAVQLDRKAEFDAIWNWANTYMFNPSPDHPSFGFYSWSLKTNATLNSDLVAPDGEEYFVMALYFAAGRWGNGVGIYNYREEAYTLLSRMVHRKPITGKTVRGQVTAGPLFNSEYKMVRFSPSGVPDHTDPSYHLPAFYELWARWGPAEDRAFWLEAARASRDFFPRATHPVTALAPDYAAFDGTPFASSRNKGAVNFRFDAWRTAMNWSVDWAWWAKDNRERELSDRLQAFFQSKGMTAYGNSFALDGTQLGNDHSPGLSAMNAVAGLAAENPRSKEFVNAFWETPIPDGIERYYDGLLYLMGMLHCAGEFRIWPPK